VENQNRRYIISHYNRIKTELKNKDSLLKALAKMGYGQEKVELHDQASALYGYQGDTRPQKANIIVRRKYVGSCANDIGWELQDDGTYAAHISDYDRGRHGKKWQEDLEMHYGIEQAKAAFSSEGWSYQESEDAEGNIQLLGQRMGGF
jgi:hypothetical protein